MKIRSLVVLSAAVALVVLPAVSASAHETRESGDHTFVVGWADEPAIAGFKNAVQFIGSHEDGDPIKGAKIQAEVLFGDQSSTTKSAPITLEPAWDTPGEYLGYLIPMEPGTYTFHIFGTLEEGEEIDEYFTSGEDTFGSVEDPAEMEFPPPPDMDELEDAADDADDTAEVESAGGGSNTLAIVGVILGGIALVLSGVAISRKRSA